MKLIKVDDKVWRGSRPESDEDFKRIKDAGINSIFSLDGENADPDTMEIYVINWVAIFPKSRDELKLMWNMALKMKGPILIHCQSGVDRTGLMIAHYRIYQQNWKYEDAITEMRLLGQHWWFRFWSLAL